MAVMEKASERGVQVVFHKDPSPRAGLMQRSQAPGRTPWVGSWASSPSTSRWKLRDLVTVWGRKPYGRRRGGPRRRGSHWEDIESRCLWDWGGGRGRGRKKTQTGVRRTTFLPKDQCASPDPLTSPAPPPCPTLPHPSRDSSGAMQSLNNIVSM